MLERAGYTCVRSAASKGKVDLVAWNSTSLRLIQCKVGTKIGQITALEREALALMDRPACATVEIWRWAKGHRDPIIEVIK